MSLIPGIPGQKTELFDGAKIDAISEYTVGNGVQHQGRTNGTAISTGFVGETIEVNTITGYTGLSNVWSSASDVLVLPSGGKWLLMYTALVMNEGISRSSIMAIRMYDVTIATEVPLSHGTHLNQMAFPSIAYGTVTQFAFYSTNSARNLVLQIACEVNAAASRAQLIKEFSGLPGDDHSGKFSALRIA